MVERPGVTAWRPPVAGIREVFHAHFTHHAYPMHSHDTWTLLLIDDGMVRYDLDRHEHGALTSAVTLLPPGVPHNGTGVGPHGFRKRVLYLDTERLGENLIGRAVDRPVLADPALRGGVDALHRALARPGETVEAESRLALVTDRLREHLTGTPSPPPTGPARLAEDLRDLLDERVVSGISLAEAAETLHCHPGHLVRTFRSRFGMPPHQYLTARRVWRARDLLLAGLPPGEVALACGFCDQAHLHRHFRRFWGVTPGRFARGGPAGPAPVQERAANQWPIGAIVT